MPAAKAKQLATRKNEIVIASYNELLTLNTDFGQYVGSDGVASAAGAKGLILSINNAFVRAGLGANAPLNLDQQLQKAICFRRIDKIIRAGMAKSLPRRIIKEQIRETLEKYIPLIQELQQ